MLILSCGHCEPLAAKQSIYKAKVNKKNKVIPSKFYIFYGRLDYKTYKIEYFSLFSENRKVFITFAETYKKIKNLQYL